MRNSGIISPSPRTQPNSVTQPLLQRSGFRPPNLSTLARLTRQYSCRNIGSRTSLILEDEPCGSEGEEETSESETSSEADASTSICSLEKQPYRIPRVLLLDLPIEILEHIASSLRDPIPVLDAAGRFIDERYSDFSKARFSLSALSKVSSSVRRAAEHILYRDVALDFTGWKGRKNPTWPAGSLRLLLRTLEERPELGRFIYAAALDYQLTSESGALEAGLAKFLDVTPNLKTLFLTQCPLALWEFPLLKTLTFSTTFAVGILPSVLEQFPNLQNLHLRDCHVMGFTLDLPKHNLKTLRFDSSHDHAAAHLSRALSVCSDTIHHLDIRFIGGLLHPSPFFTTRAPPLPATSGANLRSLRLDNISIFSNVDSGYAKILHSLPVLKELHVSNHTCFSPTAFCILPPSLQVLTVTDYHGYWEVRSENAEKNNFLIAMALCISTPARSVSSVVASNGRQGNEGFDLQPVSDACELGGIKFSNIDRQDHFIQINFCAT